MTYRLATATLAIALIALAGGCSDSSRLKATGKGSIRGINSIVTSPELNFLIEEVGIGNVSFKGSTVFTEYDDLTYNFNFDIFLPDATSSTRIARQFIDVIADTEYTVVLTGSFDNPSIMLWEEDERDWAGTETVLETDFVHVAPQVGEVDVYFQSTGTAPVLGNEVGTLSNGARLPYREFADGEYELVVTAPDDPATILFQSLPITTAPATRATFIVFDPDPSVTSTISVSLISAAGSSVPLAEANSPPQIRVLHSAFGTQNVDAFSASDFTNPVFQNVGFGNLTAYSDTSTDQALFSLTAVGDSSSVVFENDLTIPANSRRTIVLTGAPGSLGIRALVDDARPLSTFPVIRISNFSVNNDTLDIYTLEPGTPVDDNVFPRFLLAPTLPDTGFAAYVDDVIEFTVTVIGEKTPVSTPMTVNVAPGDYLDIGIFDTADPATVEMIVFDSNQL